MRETYEWCNLWWEKASDHTTSRALLIGDSIANGYRQFVNELFDDINIDMLATSKAIDDVSYKSELKYALSEYQYKVIHFNNGLHGWHVKTADYRKCLKDVVAFIMRCQPKARLILVSSTPVTIVGDRTKLDNEKNDVIIERNYAMADIALKYSLPYNDLYSKMIGKSELRMEDGFHYNEYGKKEQAEIVASFIRNNVKEFIS